MPGYLSEHEPGLCVKQVKRSAGELFVKFSNLTTDASPWNEPVSLSRLLTRHGIGSCSAQRIVSLLATITAQSAADSSWSTLPDLTCTNILTVLKYLENSWLDFFGVEV